MSGSEGNKSMTEEIMYISETSKARHRLKQFCIGEGVDLGYGGDPIVPWAITIDSGDPSNFIGSHPLHLLSDATNLYWFKDNVLDFVYSSHLLEDFTKEQIIKILKEWFRVLRIKGNLVLYLPNDALFKRHCENTGQVYNINHKESDFNLLFLKEILYTNFYGHYIILHEQELSEIYSFDLVLRKIL